MSGKERTYLIGFDLGTSALKAILATSEGTIHCQASRQVTLLRPQQDQVEIDVDSYFAAVCSLLTELTSAVSDPGNIKAICLSGASGNTLLLDEDHQPLTNAISWLDNRSAGEVWPKLDGDHIYHRVGWPFGGTFPLAHLSWFRQKSPEVWKQARYFTMLNDYIYYRLCGRLIVDHSKATTFYLQNQMERHWDDNLLAFLGIGEDGLSELAPSGSRCGTLCGKIAIATGLDAATQIITGSFDHPAAARSTGVLEEGDLLISAGTSWVAFAPLREREKALQGQMLIDPFLAPAGCWGGIFALTAVAEKVDAYLQSCISAQKNENETLLDAFNRLAGMATPGADGLLLNPLEQPYEESNALLEKASPQNIARALMEGVAFLICNRVEKLRQLTGHESGRVVLTGGPSRSALWPRILAEVLGCPIVIPSTGQHAGAMGSVILAGIGMEFYADERDGYEKTRSAEQIITPNPEISRHYRSIYKDYVAQFKLDD